MNLPEDFHREPPPRRNRDGGAALIAGLILGLIVVAGAGWFVYRFVSARAQRAEMEAFVAQKQAELNAQIRARQPLRIAIRVPQPLNRDGVAQESVVADSEGKLLWASPTRGAPISLAYVPPGAQCLVHLRPALLAAHAEREKVLAGLGPWGKDASTRLEELAGVPLAEIDAVLVAILGGRDGAVDVCLRISVVNPVEGSGLKGAPDGWRRFAAPQTVDPERRTLVICPAHLADELEASNAEPPLLARDIEQLFTFSDRDRIATVIVSPKFFAAGGAQVVAGHAEPLAAVLDALVGRESTAIALSIHWDERFFVELRAAPALTTAPRYLATVINQRIAAAPDELNQAIAERSWTEFAQPVVARFPAMVRKLSEYTRHAESDRQAVLRAYLPAVAGHNLVMGAELLLTQASGPAGRDAVATGPTAPVDVAATLDDRLAAPISLAFPRESFERALELWSAEAGVAAAIDGPAFQAAGITRNQSLELDVRDRPAGEALLEILRRANPDRTATSATDPRQALVYVVESAEADAAANGGAGGSRIIVTTRAAAAERGLPLPAVFTVGGE